MTQENKPFIILVVLGVVGVLFWMYGPTIKNMNVARTGDLPASAVDQLPPPPPPPSIPMTPAIEIEATHVYAAGTHTITGVIHKEAPCDTVTTGVVVGKSVPEQVLVTITDTPSKKACAAKTSDEKFKVSFAAGPDAMIKPAFNGQSAVFKFEGE